MENTILNLFKKFRFLGLVFLFTYSYQINAQCGTPVVGCPGTDFGNFGYNSNANASTIEYDNFISTYHTTVVRDADGNFQVWGEQIGHDPSNPNNSINLLNPVVINTTNFPGFTGTPLKAALGGYENQSVQGVLLTTTGLHVWGEPGMVVSSSLTTNWRMQPISPTSSVLGLPAGVTPAMVKMMFVTYQTIAITTCDGDAYVLSQNSNLNQGGSSTAWTRVQDSSNNYLTEIVVLRGAANVLFALKSDNTLYTWGRSYLGDNSAVSARNRATVMDAPVSGIDIKMISATNTGTGNSSYPTYYVLAKNGNLYSMGRNNVRQVGDWTETHRQSWVQPRYTSTTGQVMSNIKWISPNEHDQSNAAINVITTDAKLYNWGVNTNNRYMLGRGTTTNVYPGIPNGPLTDDILAVETGGHTTMITMKCTENFGYVGHRIRGSMGNGSGSDVNEQNFTFATAAVQICGAETIPIVNKITINMNSDGTVCQDGAVTLVPDIPGGTYSFYTAVPGSPGYSFYDPADPKRNIADGGIANFSNGTNGTPGDSTNTLTFNGTGTVKVVYSVTGDCGPVEVVTTDFVVIDCVADLEITKSVSPTNANAGDTVTFTINVENLGPQRAKEVQVTELLPAGYTYVNHAVSTGSYNNTTGLWDGFYLIDGNSATLTVTATVNANGPYLNTATVSSGTPDPNLTNNEDTAAVTIPTADLAIEKTVSNATPNVGDTITFTLAVTNNGTANAANVSISDVVPNGYTIGTINNGGVNTAGTIVWSIGNLANGATTTVTFTVTVNATGNYANTATVSSDTPDSDLTNNEDSVTTTPVTPNTTHAVNDINNTYANTSISGSVATNDFDNEGHAQTYTPIDTTDANGNHLVLNSDGTYTFTPGTDFTGTLVYTYTVCDNGTPQACDTATLTIEVLPLPEPGENRVTANNDTATTESGQAVNINVVANDFDMEGDAFTVTSNTNSTNGTLVNNGDGTFTYTPNTGFTGVDTFTYTICDNGTPQACDTATVSVTVLPDNGENDTYANDDTFNGNQGTVITGNVLTNDVDPEGNTQTVASNTQPANGVVVMNPDGTFTYTPNDPNFTGTDQFIYTVCDNGTPQACDTATVYITVNPVYVPQADLSIVKTVSNATPNVGDVVTFTLAVTNNGTDNASNVVITDVVPSGYTIGTINNGGVNTAGTITWSIANLANGATTTVTFTATVNATGNYANTATVSSDTPDSDLTNNEDSVTTTPIFNPEITLLKEGVYADANSDTIVNVGDTIVYTFTVTNTGNVTVNNLTINDAVIGVSNLTVTPSTLLPGQVGTATATYAITQADINNGGVHNIATATGTDPNNNPVTDDSEDPTPIDPSSPDYDPSCPTCTFTDLQQTPQITLLKDGVYADANSDTIVNVGDTIVYTFTVTNTGNVTVNNLTINDAVIGVSNLTVTPSTLTPGQVGTATATYAITQADINNGGVHNIATATGTDPNNNPVTDDSEDPTPIDPSSPDYDPSCPTCTFTDLGQTPQITLLKDGVYADANADTIVNVGDTIVYTFTVTNTGNVTVNNLTINDAVIGVSNLTVTPSTLLPGQVGTATATYAITQADINNGGVHNIATATGTDPNNNPVTDDSEDPTPIDPSSPDYDPSCPTCTFTDLGQTPQITLLKDGVYTDANADTIVNVGDTIVYTFTVTNTGNVTVNNLTINDAVIGVSNLTVTPSTLLPGQVGTATATYAITQADINNGGVHNIATATGTDPNNNPVTDDSEDPTPIDPSSPDYDPSCPTCTFTDLGQTPQITLLKDGVYTDANADTIVNVGDTIVYTFTVTNTGNVTVNNLTINDAVIGVSNLTVTPSTLLPGQVGTATATYAITQADINNGGVHNIATATGTDPNNNPVTDDSEDPTPIDPSSPDYDPSCPTCTFTDLGQTPQITLLKDGVYTDANADTIVNVGDTIVYTFTVTNTGNVTVNNLTINDAVIGVSNLTVTPSTLLPGQVGTATATYAITQADINNGGVHNIATATGTDPNNNPVTDDSEDPTPIDPSSPDYDPSCPTCTFTDLGQTPQITLLKDGVYTDANADTIVNVGDTIVYTFTVTNTGNVTVNNLTINDAVIGVSNLTVTPSTLLPGQVGTATATYAITQADINNGGVHNIATATGTDPNNNPVTDDSEDPTPIDPSSPDYDPSCPTCTFTDLQQTPQITLLKDGVYADANSDTIVNVGDTIVYTFTVTNTGNVTVNNLTINDAVIGVSNLTVTPSTLLPGQVGTATATYAITQADINNGGVHNIATATGTDPNNNPVTDDSEDPTPIDPSSPDYDPSCPTCTFTDLQQTPQITLLKDGVYTDANADTIVNVGDTIVYTFTVTNTGNVTVSNLTIDDTVIGVSGLVVNPSTLAPGQIGTATVTYNITQEDINIGQVLNIAFVEGEGPNGDIVFDESEDPTPFDPTDPTTIVILEQAPNIALIKEGYFNDENADGYAQPGETITYTFVVTNTGNTTLNNVVVAETNFSGVGNTPVPVFVSAMFGSPEGTLLVGESATYTANYVIVGPDLVAGSITNQATATAVGTNGEAVSDTSDDPNDLGNVDADNDGDPDDPTVIELPDGCKIIVNNGVSPNGDGINDYLHIYGLGCYSSNEIEIFNRWGVKVFETKNYENSDVNGFKGISNGRTTINQGDGLPTGHYWYVLKYLGFDGKHHSKTGYIYVSQ